jgi:hypothetical protein
MLESSSPRVGHKNSPLAFPGSEASRLMLPRRISQVVEWRGWIMALPHCSNSFLPIINSWLALDGAILWGHAALASSLD